MSQTPLSLGRAIDTREAKSCLDAVAALPLGNAERTHRRMARLLTEMRRTPPPVAGYLEVLESMAKPLAFVQAELAGRYADQPLPPNPAENQVFEAVVALWRLMAQGYAQIAQTGGEQADIQRQLALLCQRSLHYSGLVLIEHFRARRVPAPGLWLDIHAYYVTAEKWGLTGVVVWEVHDVATSCGDTYTALLLADLADLYAHSPREISWVLGWAQHFASLTSIRSTNSVAAPCSYGVDLVKDRGLRLVDDSAPEESLRYLDTARLAPYLQQLIAQLERGVPPATLGLGRQCHQPSAARLLSKISRAWCQPAAARRYPRSKLNIGKLLVCSGLDAIHFHVGGGAALGQQDPRAASKDHVLEQWRMIDQSLNGFSVQRESVGGRIGHGELFGIRSAQFRHFLLAKVRWIKLELNGQVHAGIQVLPGAPQAIRVRGASTHPAGEYLRALLMPAVPALRLRASLVLPRGCCQPGELIEMHTDRRLPVRLIRLLSQGSNFEQMSFAEA